MDLQTSSACMIRVQLNIVSAACLHQSVCIERLACERSFLAWLDQTVSIVLSRTPSFRLSSLEILAHIISHDSVPAHLVGCALQTFFKNPSFCANRFKASSLSALDRTKPHSA